jgi:hypothetical protein
LGCTLYFFSKAGDLPQHDEWVSSIKAQVPADEYMNKYADGYDCERNYGHADASLCAGVRSYTEGKIAQ